MRNFFINRLLYKIRAQNGEDYGAEVKFERGLNIVYGPNSLGKTSIITGIIYGLGAEKALGIFKSNQNPFKPEFYDRIDGSKVTKSFLLLEISNGLDTITIARSIIKKTNVAGIKRCKLIDFEKTKKIDYLVATGDGVAQEGGLQHFLFQFLNIEFVSVPTYDGDTSKVYLENLAPLFFVEQRAGWSQIQARQITRYGIRDVRKVAFEYILGLEKFNSHLIEIEKKEISEKIRKKKALLSDREEELIVAVNGSKSGRSLIVEREDLGKASIFDAIKYLQEKYDSQITNLESLGTAEESILSVGRSQRTNLNRKDFQLRKAVDRANKLASEIKGYESYIDRIQINKRKNKQLKRIEGLALNININSCPVCESDLLPENVGHCKLCQAELNRKVSTPDQNLSFLEDEETSFREVLKSKRLALRKIQQQVKNLKEDVRQLEDLIDHHTRTYMGNNLANIRAKVAALDHLKEEIKRYNWAGRKWKELASEWTIIDNLNSKKDELDKKLKSIKTAKRDKEILASIVSHFKSNVRKLDLFRKKEFLIDRIKIDETDNYTPYLDSYDIYNIVSSSDNVRIMLSYYLSLLQTSIGRPEDGAIKFPNLLILDEPKQQNLDNQSLRVFIELIEKLNKNQFQIILTTFSHVEKERALFKDYICHEMVDSTDYLLKKISPKK